MSFPSFARRPPTLSTTYSGRDMSGIGNRFGSSSGCLMIASGLWPGALGGTRTPNLLIRSKIRAVSRSTRGSMRPGQSASGSDGVHRHATPLLAHALALRRSWWSGFGSGVFQSVQCLVEVLGGCRIGQGMADGGQFPDQVGGVGQLGNELAGPRLDISRLTPRGAYYTSRCRGSALKNRRFFAIIDLMPEEDQPDARTMMLAFRATNARSFRDPLEFSLEATAVSEEGVPRYVPWRQGGSHPLRVLPVAGVFGANASGKTNFLRIMDDMRRLVLSSFKAGDRSTRINRRAFRLDPDYENAPTSYEIDLILSGVRYEYGFSVDSSHVLSEYARRYPRGKAVTIFVGMASMSISEKSIGQRAGLLPKSCARMPCIYRRRRRRTIQASSPYMNGLTLISGYAKRRAERRVGHIQHILCRTIITARRSLRCSMWPTLELQMPRFVNLTRKSLSVIGES